MAPESGENKEFTRWFEQWITRIQASTLHEHEPPDETRGEGDERPEHEEEPTLKH